MSRISFVQLFFFVLFFVCSLHTVAALMYEQRKDFHCYFFVSLIGCLQSMEKVVKMWGNLRSRCQALFHKDGTESNLCSQDLDCVHCVVDLGRGAHAEPYETRSSTPSRTLSPLPLVTGRRRGHNCVADIPQIVEISIDKESDDARRGPLVRRDSYSRHAPWGGKKKHSCSTKTQSSLFVF